MSSLPECRCGRTCLSKEVYKGENRGRWYWKCALSRCGYFQWNDPGPHLYQPIVFTAPKTQKHDGQYENDRERRDPSALHIDDILYPLGARKSRVSSIQRSKRNRTSEMHNTPKVTIQLALYTSTDISVHANERHRQIQTIFRTVKGVVWNERLHLWLFSANQQTYQTIWSLLHQHRATFDVIGVPLAVLRYLPKTMEQFRLQHYNAITAAPSVSKPSLPLVQENRPNNNNDDYGFDLDGDNDIADDDVSELPISWFQREVTRGSRLWQSMNRAQRNAVKKGAKLDGGIYMHDTVGSGRSLKALAMTLVYQDDWPVLIVCRDSACQAWKKLIQSMLQLDKHDICFLDYVASYTGKKVYSNSRKAIQSRLYRKRRRELLQQQLRQGITSGTSTDHQAHDDQELEQQQQALFDGEDGWCVSLSNDGGDGPALMGCLMKDTMLTTFKDSANSKSITKRKLEQQQDQQLNIALNNDGGDVFSDDVKMDNDLFDTGLDETYDLGASSDNIYDTCTTLVENDNYNTNNNTNTNNTNNTDKTNNINNIDNGDEKSYHQAISSTAQFFIISYDRAKTRLSSLSTEKFKIAIFDDCHDIKHYMIPTYRSALLKFVRSTKKTIMVSDIPIIPKPMESFPLLEIIKPNLFLDFKYFGHRYCDAKHLVFGWDYSGTSNEFELGYLLERTVYVL